MCNDLTGYIGIIGCSEDAPESGLYINDVPGITTLKASMVADNEKVTGNDLLESCLSRAYTDVFTDLLAKAAQYGVVYRAEHQTHGANMAASSDIQVDAGTTYTLTLYTGSEWSPVKFDRAIVYADGAGTLTWTSECAGVTGGGTKNLVTGRNDLDFGLSFRSKVVLTFTCDVNVQAWGQSSCGWCGSSGVANLGVVLTKGCDDCSIAYHYRSTWKKLFQLRGAINFFVECLVSPRINQSARHSLATAERMLIQLQGGVDASNNDISGEYTVLIDQMASAFARDVRANRPSCVSCGGNKILWNKP